MKTPYRRITLEQGTPEWLQWRHQGIGGSDAPAVLGECKWKTRAELLQDKLNPPGPGIKNAAMLLGTQLEPIARESYCATTGKMVTPACLESTTHDWLRISVDGISDCGSHLVEIKCGESVYRYTEETGKAPGYYHGQLQHALLVTGLPEMDFWAYWPDCPPLHVVIPRDEPYIERLLREEAAFWKELEETAR